MSTAHKSPALLIIGILATVLFIGVLGGTYKYLRNKTNTAAPAVAPADAIFVGGTFTFSTNGVSGVRSTVRYGIPTIAFSGPNPSSWLITPGSQCDTISIPIGAPALINCGTSRYEVRTTTSTHASATISGLYRVIDANVGPDDFDAKRYDASFQQAFATCAPATSKALMNPDGSTMELRVLGPSNIDSGCLVMRSYITHTNPILLNKAVVCSLDQKLDYLTALALQNSNRCAGPLWDAEFPQA